MATTKKASISALDKIIKENFEDSKTIIWNNIELHVKRVLGLKESLAFVDDIVSSCFIDSSKEYLPEVEDFAIRCATVEAYTNVKLPEPIEHKHRIMYMTDLFAEVQNYIDMDQFEDLCKAAHEKARLAAESNIVALQNEVRKAVESVETLVSGITDMFSGIEAGDIKKFVDSVGSNGALDEEKLVRLITSQQGKAAAESGEIHDESDA